MRDLEQICMSYLKTLCLDIGDRSVGSEGNRKSTDFFEKELVSLGWSTGKPGFDVVDWEEGGVNLQSGDDKFIAYVSPYSLGCSVKASLVVASSIEELEKLEMLNKILLLYGNIAKEQLMPKNFVFYNPERHQKIISLLEKKKPIAIIAATTRNSSLAGGLYPFPLIEDGDFDIPSVYMTEEEGKKLLSYIGKEIILESISKRIPSKAYNVIGKKGESTKDRIVITAHIDTKKGTSGAIDNATGVVVLLLLGHLLKDYSKKKAIELVAFNGEDYYAVPGQMHYIREIGGLFQKIALNINIDGLGYLEGKSAFSLFDLPEHFSQKAKELISENSGIVEGSPWPQGDHSIFIQNGCPAIAVSSNWFIENMETQDVTHTPKDNIEIVDCKKVVEVASALEWFINEITIPNMPLRQDARSTSEKSLKNDSDHANMNG